MTQPLRRSLALAAPLVLVAAWAVLVAWRPFAFGFYHDDWSSVALPLDRSSTLLKMLAGDPARPLYLLILWGLRNVFAAHAWAWQAALAVLHLACAIGVARAADALFGPDDAPATAWRWPGVVAGVSWLAFPWSLGYSAWPVMLPPLVGIGLAAWSLAVAAGASRRRDMVIAAVLLCASWTIYEATWFFWLPPALLLLARIRHRRPSDRTFWTFVGLLAVLQVAFVVLNRLLATGSPVAKKLSGQLLGTLATDEHLLGAQLLPQLQAVWLPLQVGLAVLLACALLQSLRSGSFLRLLVQLAVPVCGMAITVLLYAAAGYAIEWEGLFSRVTLAISFWLALLAGALAQATEGAGWKTLRWTGRGAATVVCVALAASLLQQSQPWLRSWEEQQAIVAAFPEPVLKRVNPQTLVLMELPRGPAPVYGFSAFWDISGALIARVPREQTISSSTHAYATVMRPTEWRTSWDGAELRQSWCSSPDSILWRLPAERVIVWRYPGQEVVEVAPGFTTGCAAKPAP